MDPELRDLLRVVATESNNPYTHQTYYNPSNKWNITAANEVEFWRGYCDLVERKVEGGDSKDEVSGLNIGEKVKNSCQVVAKLLFRFQSMDKDDSSWEPYDDLFLQMLCYIYQQAILENVDIPETEGYPQVIAIVLESNNVWTETNKDNKQSYICSEVRIHFPFCRVNVDVQNTYIRDRVIQLLRITNASSSLPRQPVGDWDQIISPLGSSLPMYGSNEVLGRPNLKVTKIWPYITPEYPENEVLQGEYELHEVCMPEQHRHFHKNASLAEFISQAQANEKPAEYFLPFLLSTGYTVKLFGLKPGITPLATPARQAERQAYRTPRQVQLQIQTPSREDTDDSELVIAEHLLPYISSQRYQQEAFWLDIGKALYNADNGGSEGLRIWKHFTTLATNGVSIPEFTTRNGDIEETCRSFYYTFDKSEITVKTIAWYAREDNARAYADWHKDWVKESMRMAMLSMDADVAKAFYRTYWLDYVYCPVAKGRWFGFKNNRWVEHHQGLALRKLISNDFMRKFEFMRLRLASEAHDSDDETAKAQIENSIKCLTKLIANLKSHGFKSRVLAESCEYFKNDKFLQLLDSNPDITGFTNGVLQVLDQSVLFRQSKPEDFTFMCTNNMFDPNYTWAHPLVQECMNWFKKVFPDRELLNYFLKFASSGLRGKNSDKIFAIWTGDGDNSKSMIVKLFETAFGSYCIKFPIALLTEKGGNSSGPSPQLARARNARWAFVDEPEDDVPMNKGTIKRYTGGDTFFARMLQENGGDVQLTFKMVLICNNIPRIPNADRAIKNRTVTTPYLSRWVKDPPATEAEQFTSRLFKMDPHFERRIPFLASAFLWILSEYYPLYAAEGLAVPEIVTNHTAEYWANNDLYAQFIADCLQIVKTNKGEPDTNAHTSLSEIYKEFKEWYKDTFPNTKIPERTLVRSELASKWGRMINGGWPGIRIINREDGDVSLSSGITKIQLPQNNRAPIPSLSVQKSPEPEKKESDENPNGNISVPPPANIASVVI